MSAAQIERYKQQAEILRRFLSNAGIDLKQRNALEAIAQIHSAKDWNTLAALPDPHDSSHAEDREVWVVTESLGGFAHSSVAVKQTVAVMAFLQSARLISDCFPEERVEFGGQCLDAALPNLWMKLNGQVCLTLAQPPTVEAETIKEGKIVDARVPTMGGLEQLSEFRTIAKHLTAVFRQQVGRDADERRRRGSRSAVAVHAVLESDALDRTMAEEEELVREGRLKGDPRESLSVDADAAFSGIEKIKLMMSAKALVV